MKEVQLTSEKSFQIELSSDKNNSYSIEFNLNNYIEITANQINNIIHKSYSNKYSFEGIREAKFFLKFDTFSEILDEIKDRIDNNKIILKENDNILILNIPLPDDQEIIFELNPIIKNNNDRLDELTDLIIKLNTEINNIKDEEIANLKRQINDMKEKEVLLTNDNTQLKNDINLLKKENNQLNKDNAQLKNNETQLKEEITELKEKLNILWEKRRYITNLDSKIINENKDYNEILKNWINPSRKIKAELLYRLSENEDNKLKFHELCDNKGPTLTLFHVNDGNIIGIYTPLDLDSNSLWKNDMDTFIFNLNKNQKYKKLKEDCSIYCMFSYGPYTAGFGCDHNNSMKSIIHLGNDINKHYDKGSEILPCNNQEKVYDLIETEVYKIMIK